MVEVYYPAINSVTGFPNPNFYPLFLSKVFLNNYPAMTKDGFHYFFSGLDEAQYIKEGSK
jgi:hypothetical protein